MLLSYNIPGAYIWLNWTLLVQKVRHRNFIYIKTDKGQGVLFHSAAILVYRHHRGFETNALLVLTYVTIRSVFSSSPRSYIRSLNAAERVPTPLAAWSTDIIMGLFSTETCFQLGAQSFLFTSRCTMDLYGCLIVTTGYLSSRSLSTSKTLEVLSG